MLERHNHVNVTCQGRAPDASIDARGVAMAVAVGIAVGCCDCSPRQAHATDEGSTVDVTPVSRSSPVVAASESVPGRLCEGNEPTDAADDAVLVSNRRYEAGVRRIHVQAPLPGRLLRGAGGDDERQAWARSGQPHELG